MTANGPGQDPPPAAAVWHRQLSAGRSGDWAALAAVLAPDCTWALLTQGAVFQGRDQVINFIREEFDAAATRQEPDVRGEFSTAECGVYQYTSRGTVDRDRATAFARRLSARRSIITELLAAILAWGWRGKAFEIPVCFVYHVNPDGLIDPVNEYVGKRTRPSQI